MEVIDLDGQLRSTKHFKKSFKTSRKSPSSKQIQLLVKVRETYVCVCFRILAMMWLPTAFFVFSLPLICKTLTDGERIWRTLNGGKMSTENRKKIWRRRTSKVTSPKGKASHFSNLDTLLVILEIKVRS